jgi:hypothetical protein
MFTSDAEGAALTTPADHGLAVCAHGDWCLTGYFVGFSRLWWLNKDHLPVQHPGNTGWPVSGSLALLATGLWGLAYCAAGTPTRADHKSVARIAHTKEE